MKIRSKYTADMNKIIRYIYNSGGTVHYKALYRKFGDKYKKVNSSYNRLNYMLQWLKCYGILFNKKKGIWVLNPKPPALLQKKAKKVAHNPAQTTLRIQLTMYHFLEKKLTLSYAPNK